jgi:hypothetical protein
MRNQAEQADRDGCRETPFLHKPTPLIFLQNLTEDQRTFYSPRPGAAVRLVDDAATS